MYLQKDGRGKTQGEGQGASRQVHPIFGALHKETQRCQWGAVKGGTAQKDPESLRFTEKQT